MSKILKKVLGPTYGGPSLSYDDGKFILYSWGDAPVSIEILVSDSDFVSFVQKLHEYQYEKTNKKNKSDLEKFAKGFKKKK